MTICTEIIVLLLAASLGTCVVNRKAIPETSDLWEYVLFKADGMFPFMVTVIGDDKQMCAGSLISPTFVLTAARCVVRHQNFTVLIGAQNIRTKEKEKIELRTSSKVAHSGYDEITGHHDIAVLELPVKVRLSDRIKLVKLASGQESLLESEDIPAALCGWGLYEDYGNSSDELLCTILDVISNEQCYDYDQHTSSIIYSELCATGYDNRSPCDGDEGAPLIVQMDDEYIQVGIMSHRFEEVCSNNVISSFTRVYAYLDWIEANTGVVVQ